MKIEGVTFLTPLKEISPSKFTYLSQASENNSPAFCSLVPMWRPHHPATPHDFNQWDILSPQTLDPSINNSNQHHLIGEVITNLYVVWFNDMRGIVDVLPQL